MATRHSPSNDYAQFTQPTQTPTPETPAPSPGHGHGWLMWLMCVPMLVVIGMLIAAGGLGAGGLWGVPCIVDSVWLPPAGAGGAGGLLYALGCLAMMGAMMLWMNHGNRGNPS